MNKNISWHTGEISREDRENLLNQKGKVIWFTGLSGAGKSTIAVALERELHKKNMLVYRLDGDNIRHGLNKDLGFSKQDRMENIRRIAEVAKLMADSGMIVLASFITPFEELRNKIQAIVGKEDLRLVYIKASLEICKQRDPKGLYKKAISGEIEKFTGISSAYEEPTQVDISIDTEKMSVDECIKLLLNKIL